MSEVPLFRMSEVPLGAVSYERGTPVCKLSQFDVVVIDEASQVLPPTKFTTHLHFLHNNHIYYTCIYYIATTCIYYIATTPGDGARRPPDAPAPPRPPQRVGAEQNDPCWRPPPAPAYGCCPAHKKQPSPKTLQ